MTGKSIAIYKYPIALCAMLVLLSFRHKDYKEIKTNFSYSRKLEKIPEPSDIVYDASSAHFFIVSDHGKLFECDTTGKILRKADFEGMDFEGVEVKDSFVYVSDETPRRVYKYRKSDLSLVDKYNVVWGGAMNRAYESIAYNYARSCFVMVGQQPPVIVEYDEHFKELRRQRFSTARDISGARWHNGQIYLLSNLDAGIYTCDPIDYSIRAFNKINVPNPEGVELVDGSLFIVSDNAQKMYVFNHLDQPIK